jgi:hypothetical protein
VFTFIGASVVLHRIVGLAARWSHIIQPYKLHVFRDKSIQTDSGVGRVIKTAYTPSISGINWFDVNGRNELSTVLG